MTHNERTELIEQELVIRRQAVEQSRTCALREAIAAVEDEVLIGMTEKAAQWNRAVNHCAAAVLRLLEKDDA